MPRRKPKRKGETPQGGSTTNDSLQGQTTTPANNANGGPVLVHRPMTQEELDELELREEQERNERNFPASNERSRQGFPLPPGPAPRDLASPSGPAPRDLASPSGPAPRDSKLKKSAGRSQPRRPLGAAAAAEAIAGDGKKEAPAVIKGTKELLKHHRERRIERRDYLPGGTGGDRNFATIHYNIDVGRGNREGDMESVSGKADTQHLNVPGHYLREALDFFEQNSEVLHNTREFDTERKLLAVLKEQLNELKRINSGAEPQGEIVLVSDIIPCSSCGVVIDAFRQDFPNVKIRILYNAVRSDLGNFVIPNEAPISMTDGYTDITLTPFSDNNSISNDPGFRGDTVKKRQDANIEKGKEKQKQENKEQEKKRRQQSTQAKKTQAQFKQELEKVSFNELMDQLDAAGWDVGAARRGTRIKDQEIFQRQRINGDSLAKIATRMGLKTINAPAPPKSTKGGKTKGGGGKKK